MSLWDDEEWAHTVDSSGDFARVDQLAGHLLIVFPIGYIDHHPTRFTQPGKKSDVIVCDLIDLDAADETTGVRGKVYRNAWWRQSQLIIGLRPLIGKRALGRLGKGIARNGMNAPWVLNDATQEPGAIDTAKQWAAANPGFVLSTFTAPTAPPPAPAPAPSYGQQPQFNGFGSGNVNYPPQPQQQYQQAPPQPQFQQPPQPDPWAQPMPQQPPQPQYQQAPQQGYQQTGPAAGYPAPNTAPPAFGVAGAPPMDPNMLALMRAERERREPGYGQQPTDPPF